MKLPQITSLIIKNKICLLLFLLTAINIYYFSFGYLLTADDVEVNVHVINNSNLFLKTLQDSIAQGRIGHFVHGPITYLGAYLQPNYFSRIIFTLLWFFMLYVFSIWTELVSNTKLTDLNYFFLVIFQVLAYNHLPPNSYPLFLSLPFLIILGIRIYLFKSNKYVYFAYLIQTYLMLFEYYIIFSLFLIFIELILVPNKMRIKNYLKYDIYSVLIALALIILWRWQHVSTYNGVQIANSFNFYFIIKTIVVYAIGGIALLYKINLFFQSKSIYFILFIYSFICFLLFTLIYNNTYKIKLDYKVSTKYFLIFLFCGFCCVIPTALTDRYQHWVFLGSKAYVISRVSYLFIVTGFTFLILSIPKNKIFGLFITALVLIVASYSFLHNYIMAYDMKDYCSAWKRAEALACFSGSPDPNLNISYFCDPKQRVSMHPNFDRNKYWIDFIKWKSFHNENKIPIDISLIQKYGLAESYAEGIDFTKPKKYPFLKSINGLSGQEHWGRWSDANIAATVNFQFYETLPDLFILSLRAIAFGPNIGETLDIYIAGQKYSVQIPKDGSINIKINVGLKGRKTNKIEFKPPKPTSPKELGLSDDPRKLGIGFINMKIIQNGDEIK